jgi:two-component system, cell cycle sensor histidine kinase and response regulator CckA
VNFIDIKNKFKITKEKLRGAAYIALLIVLCVLIYLTYNQYKNTIVTQQQQSMLESSRSISRGINLFIEDVQDSMKVIVLDKEFIKGEVDYRSKLKAYCDAQEKAVAAAYFFDENGKIMAHYPQSVENIIAANFQDVRDVVVSGKSKIGRARFNKNRDYFILSIYEPVFDGENLKGILSVDIRLDLIYNILIAPVRIGEKGYALVKDQKGTIIMHTVKEQVGMDVIESRKQAYPNLEYEDLERLISEQLKGKEGTAIYHSYWWGENKLRRVKKLNAYTPVRFGDQFWIVALTMSYDEIQGPINRFLAIVIGIASLVATIIYAFLLAFIKVKRNKEELEQETKYLKMLNEASEELRKKEAEMYHSHKLKMVGTLAGGIAHDINNLLTPILGYSELLLMSIPKDSENYEDAEEIYKASQKGKELVEQILLFSRNDNGMVKVEPVDIREVTIETIRLLKSVLPKNVKIREDIKIDGGYVKANFTQIHQVIFNLCTNAYQAIKHDNGEIQISLTNIHCEQVEDRLKVLDKDIEYVELTVRDNGCGMNEETKDRIFDPFFTTKTIGEGTGLGLFVVRSIIDKYGGAITVDSELGVGSCFKVYLPLIFEGSPMRNNNRHKSELGGRKRIMIVDDNEDVIKVLKKGLESFGHMVVSEDDNVKALEKFKGEQKGFDLLITDYMMPGLKGDELAAEIKKVKKSVKVILMSGYMADSEKDVKSSEGIDAFIQKPVEINKLIEIINDVLN